MKAFVRNGYSALAFIVALLMLVVYYINSKENKRGEEGESDQLMLTFRQKDASFVEDVLNMDPKSFNETAALFKFYHLISFPLQGVCRVLKRIGGQWLDWPGLPAHAVDGDKFVCMDRLYLDQPCLIYSFGIANDWTFEDFMDFRGCEIHAHDPTVDFPSQRGKNIRFEKIGLGVEKGPSMDSLENILLSNEHTDTTVEYLKIDIEGHELAGLPNWLETGALKNVNQLALELHLTGLHDGPNFIWLLEILQKLYKLNFRLISHEVNMVVGPGPHNRYTLMEVVFMKDDVWS